MKRVTFPDGTYATFRDKVNVRGRKLMERTSIPAANAFRRIRRTRLQAGIEDGEEAGPNEVVTYSESEVEAMQRFEMAGVAAMLAHWTRDDPLPRTIDEVEELDPDIYELLAAEVRPHLWDLLSRPGLTPDDAVGADGKPALDSPTGPSNGSAEGGSEERATDQSQPSETVTSTSSPGTASTPSDTPTPA